MAKKCFLTEDPDEADKMEQRLEALGIECFVETNTQLSGFPRYIFFVEPENLSKAINEAKIIRARSLGHDNSISTVGEAVQILNKEPLKVDPDVMMKQRRRSSPSKKPWWAQEEEPRNKYPVNRIENRVLFALGFIMGGGFLFLRNPDSDNFMNALLVDTALYVLLPFVAVYFMILILPFWRQRKIYYYLFTQRRIHFAREHLEQNKTRIGLRIKMRIEAVFLFAVLPGIIASGLFIDLVCLSNGFREADLRAIETRVTGKDRHLEDSWQWSYRVHLQEAVLGRKTLFVGESTFNAIHPGQSIIVKVATGLYGYPVYKGIEVRSPERVGTSPN